MKFTNNSTLNTIITVAGLIGIGYGLAMHNKLAKVSERLDRSIDSLADSMEIDIPEEMVNKAIDKAVAIAAKNAATTAANNAIAEVKRDIRNKVSDAVEKEYDTIKDKVLSAATVSASKIDVDRVRRDVEAAATKAAIDKFDVNLDDITKKFMSDLDNTLKISTAVRNALYPAATTNPNPNTREYVIKVG